MTSSTSKPATWFWIVSAIALVWNLMGAIAYITQVTMSPEALPALPEGERALYINIPSWATGAFAIAVWGGVAGSILLLLRRKLATALLVLSFAGIVVHLSHSLFISNSIEVYGPGGLIMPIMVFGIGAYLIIFSRKASTNGWLK